jgi:hypothetical protein
MEINESNLILLLQLIKAKADVEPLLKRGLTYMQISELITHCIEKKLIQQEDSGYSLTKSGILKMKADTQTGKPRKDGIWISPQEEFRIESRRSDEVYLPEMCNSFFDQ